MKGCVWHQFDLFRNFFSWCANQSSANGQEYFKGGGLEQEGRRLFPYIMRWLNFHCVWNILVKFVNIIFYSSHFLSSRFISVRLLLLCWVSVDSLFNFTALLNDLGLFFSRNDFIRISQLWQVSLYWMQHLILEILWFLAEKEFSHNDTFFWQKMFE